MLKRFIILCLLSLGLGACAPQIQPHRLSQADISSFGLSSIEANVQDPSKLAWPVRNGDSSVKAKHTPTEVLSAVEHAFNSEFKGALQGNRKVKLLVQIDGVMIMSDDERAAQIALTGVLGGPVGMVTVAATPMKVGMQSTVSLVDIKTNQVLASSPISTVVSQEGKSDPGPALFRQNALDARQWLLSVR